MKKALIALSLVLAVFFAAAPVGAQVGIQSGDLIKSDAATAVYYFGYDGKRYVFPNDKTYFTWYGDFSTVKTISTGELAVLPIGGNVTYRPGTRMIKIQSDPKVYAVSKNGILRAIGSEAVAAALYGSNWNKQIDDLQDAFFVNYKVGAPIAASSGYEALTLRTAVPNINTDKLLIAAPAGYVDVRQNSNFGANADMTIAPNGKITWIAIDNSQPSIKVTSPSTIAITVQSNTMAMGETYTYAFPQAGAWTYSNANVSGGMSGKVNVQ